MRSRKIIFFSVVVGLLTAFAALQHFAGYQQVPEDQLLISTDEKIVYVDIQNLEYKTVTGTRVNGKGESIPIEMPGIAMKELLDWAGFEDYDRVTVAAEDSYQAEVTAEEISEEGQVYLLKEDQKRLRLVVFGDEDSKRSISDVVKITVRNE